MGLRMKDVAVLGLSVFVLGSVPGNASPAKGWTLDPAHLGKLAPLTAVAGFKVRPPRGCAGGDQSGRRHGDGLAGGHTAPMGRGPS